MGIAALAATVGLSLLQKMSADAAAEKQFEAEQEELLRQEFESNRQAAEDASDEAEKRDRQMASARAAMEAIGGFGSVNDDRAQAEIAGLKGLDLARIESTRTSKSKSLQSAQEAAGRRLKAAKIESSQAVLGSVLGGSSTFMGGQRSDTAASTARDIFLRSA